MVSPILSPAVEEGWTSVPENIEAECDLRQMVGGRISSTSRKQERSAESNPAVESQECGV